MLTLNPRTFWDSIIEPVVARKARIAFAAFLAVLLGCGAFAFGVRAYSARRELYLAGAERAKSLAAIPSPSAPPAAPSQSQAQLSDGIVLTLRPQGFEPSAVTRPAGRMVLVINNRSGLRAVSLNLDQEAGARLRTVSMARARRLWGEAVELAPGNYVLTEASHPSWVCNLTVTKR